MVDLFFILLGLVFGSFLGVISHRLPLGESFAKGRSRCPRCKAKISWYDNIPLLSYLFLKGKCRSCKKKISIRYPLIELLTALLFWIFFRFSFFWSCHFETICRWKMYFGNMFLPFVLFLTLILILILVIDLEHMVIPDPFIFLGVSIAFLLFLLTDKYNLFENLFSAGLFSSFFLLLNLITKGKGMGLGDVKLAFLIGLLLGIKLSFYWFVVSFLTGAGVGIILILVGKLKFGKHIPFGPFMILSFFLTLFLENYLTAVLPI